MRRLAGAVIGGALLLIAGVSTAAPGATTETVHWKDFTELRHVEDCFGVPAVAEITSNGLLHTTALASGGFHAVYAESGAASVTTSTYTYQGRFTVHDSFNLNRSNATGTFTLTSHAVSADGGRQAITIVGHFVVTASGVVREWVKVSCAQE